VSGLLVAERERVGAAYRDAGLGIEESLASGDWAAFLISR
jgi:ribosomal protein L11 methylase PrmA